MSGPAPESGKRSVAQRSWGRRCSPTSHRAFWKVPPGPPQPTSFVAEPGRVTRRKSRPTPLPPPLGYLGNGAGARGVAAPKGLVGVDSSRGCRGSWNLLDALLYCEGPECGSLVVQGSRPGAVGFRGCSGSQHWDLCCRRFAEGDLREPNPNPTRSRIFCSPLALSPAGKKC